MAVVVAVPDQKKARLESASLLFTESSRTPQAFAATSFFQVRLGAFTTKPFLMALAVTRM